METEVKVERGMERRHSPRGTLWLAVLGYLGVVGSVASGLGRWVIIVFATIGILGYTSEVTKLDRYVAYHSWLRWHRSRYHTWMGHTIQIQPPGPGNFHVRIYHGHKDEESPREMPERVKNLLGMKGIRCELRQPWHLRKYRCSAPRWIRSSNYVEVDVPQELALVENGTIRLVGGPYLVRWKRDGRIRALARCYVGFDERGYQRHVLVRTHLWWQQFRVKLQDESKWKRPLL